METLRDYFSWSQYSLWNSSKKAYYKKYILGEEDLENKRFIKGNELGEYMETGKIPYTVKNIEMLDFVCSQLDRLECMEHKIEVCIGDYKLLSYIDSGMENYSDLFEYKTGKEPWDQYRVNLHEQLDFYATCYYIASGEKIIPNIKLFWAETEDIENEDGTFNIEFTGRVEVFERKITINEIVLMLSKIIKSIEDIKKWEYKDTEINNQDAERFLFLKERIKSDTEEADLLKLKIESFLIDKKVNYGFCDSEKGYKIELNLSERKNKEYPEEILTKENKYKDEIAYLKKLSDKELRTKIKVSKSLRYNKVEIKQKKVN